MQHPRFLPTGFALVCAAVLSASGCSRPVDAQQRSEVVKFLQDLAKAASDLDVGGYAAAFAPGCPVVVEVCGKTKQTTIEKYRRTLEEAASLTTESRVVLTRIEVRPGGRRLLATADARETSVNMLGRTTEGRSTNEFELERRPEGLRVVSYRTRLTITKIKDPLLGEVDPRDPSFILDWTDPEAR